MKPAYKFKDHRCNLLNLFSWKLRGKTNPASTVQRSQSWASKQDHLICFDLTSVNVSLLIPVTRSLCWFGFAKCWWQGEKRTNKQFALLLLLLVQSLPPPFSFMSRFTTRSFFFFSEGVLNSKHTKLILPCNHIFLVMFEISDWINRDGMKIFMDQKPK